MGVVAAHADAADGPSGFQLLRVGHDWAVCHLVPIFQGIHMSGSSHINIVGAQPFQHVGKSGFYFFYAAGPLVLAVLPNGAQMPLQDKFLRQ